VDYTWLTLAAPALALPVLAAAARFEDLALRSAPPAPPAPPVDPGLDNVIALRPASGGQQAA
jgi:hypothetical protein